jgi:glycosyltransferase involved in cell wall biosynthesis
MRAAYLRARIHVTVLAPEIPESAREEGIVDVTHHGGTIYKPSPLWRALQCVAPYVVHRRFVANTVADAARWAHARRKIDILQMEESFGWAYFVRRGLDIPVVVRLHGPWFLNGTADGVVQDKEFRRRLRDEGRAIAAADGVTAPSHDVLERTREFYGLPLEHAEVIPNPREEIAEDVRWTLSDCKRNTVLFVGRFDRHKGGDVMLDAFHLVRQQIPEARLVFVGPDRGCVDDSGRRWSIDEYAAERLSPEDRTHFEYAGQQPNDAIPQLRRKANVVVVCSRWENFANTATEALSSGCPLVVSNAGGLPEIVQHECNGLLCRPGDATDLAEKVTTLLGNSELAARLGKQASLDSEKRYDPDRLACLTLDFYGQVIERARQNKKGGSMR